MVLISLWGLICSKYFISVYIYQFLLMETWQRFWATKQGLQIDRRFLARPRPDNFFIPLLYYPLLNMSLPASICFSFDPGLAGFWLIWLILCSCRLQPSPPHPRILFLVDCFVLIGSLCCPSMLLLFSFRKKNVSTY